MQKGIAINNKNHCLHGPLQWLCSGALCQHINNRQVPQDVIKSHLLFYWHSATQC